MPDTRPLVPPITKEQFVEVMDYMHTRDKQFNDLCALLEDLTPGFRIDFLPNIDYNNKIIYLLNILLAEPQEDSLIEYFICELDWGTSPHATNSLTFNDTVYDLSSVKKLYDALVDINFNHRNEIVHPTQQEK